MHTHAFHTHALFAPITSFSVKFLYEIEGSRMCACRAPVCMRMPRSRVYAHPLRVTRIGHWRYTHMTLGHQVASAYKRLPLGADNRFKMQYMMTYTIHFIPGNLSSSKSTHIRMGAWHARIRSLSLSYRMWVDME